MTSRNSTKDPRNDMPLLAIFLQLNHHDRSSDVLDHFLGPYRTFHYDGFYLKLENPILKMDQIAPKIKFSHFFYFILTWKSKFYTRFLIERCTVFFFISFFFKKNTMGLLRKTFLKGSNSFSIGAFESLIANLSSFISISIRL
jgi:hypothetical protein